MTTNSKSIIIKSLAEINQAARQFIDIIGTHKHIAFYADMGSGKTTFITALCKELGVIDQVTSPTFTIVNEYKDLNNNDIYHFDFYRINKIEELYDIGFEEYIDNNALCLFEWPELAEGLLPEDTIKFKIEIIENDFRKLYQMHP